MRSLEAELWAAGLAEHADLPDERLNQRLAEILAIFARRSHDRIPQACQSRAATKATYRFFSNHRIQAERLHEAVAAATVDQCRGQSTILAVHDTTSLNYSARSTTGLGPIGSSGTAQGLYLHSSLALRIDGVALGLLHQECWSRPSEKRPADHQSLRFEDKESVKWACGVGGCELALDEIPEAERPRVIHLMDREGDIHEMLESIANTTDGCVIRSTHNRLIEGDLERAHNAVASAPLLGVHTITVPRRPGQAQRKAKLEIRAVTVTVQPRRHCAAHADREPFSLQLVEAREVEAPPKAAGLHWLLWTTEPARSFAEAVAVVQLYQQRWKIEDFHLTLKSGCRIEELELETAERLHKAVVIYSAVASHLLAMRDLARAEPNAPCTRLLSHDAWKALWGHIHEKPWTPKHPIPTMEQAVKWIGRLGGHLNRKRDGMPGVRTLWRGYRDLTLLVLGYRMARATA